jgi:peptidoglycan/LPS O-acetylase OafA/YrhL
MSISHLLDKPGVGEPEPTAMAPAASRSAPAPESIGALHAAGRNNFHLLRLLAALAVIYGHSYPVTGSGGGDFYLMHVGNKFIGGVAVDVFFVASGFLIMSSLERGSLARYLWARCLRIYPALLVAVGLSVLVLGPLLTTSPTYWHEPATWSYLYKNGSLLGTEYFLPGVFQSNPDKAVNGSLWSLPVEFSLYLVFLGLALCRLLTRERYTWFVLATFLGALAFASSTPWFAAHPNWVNTSALFLAGGLVWKRRDEIRLSIWGVIFGLGACVALHKTPGFEIAYSLTLVYLVFYFAYALRLPVIARRDLSYGTYLYGWPAQQLAVLSGLGTTPASNFVMAAALALLLALFSWELVERPMLRLKDWVR